MQRPSAIYL